MQREGGREGGRGGEEGEREIWEWRGNAVRLAWNTHPGIVFENLDGNDLSYKIRLRHEVGNADSWNTDLAGPNFELPGPRIPNRCLLSSYSCVE